MHGSINAILFGGVAILALLLGLILIVISSALLHWGRSKEKYPARIAQRIGTFITGTAIAVLLILFAFN